MNPVAKHAFKYNKCFSYKDKNFYSRKNYLVEDEPPLRTQF